MCFVTLPCPFDSRLGTDMELFVNCCDGRLLAQVICTKVLNPALLPEVLRSVRGALFPNNGLAPARAVPDAAECLLIRRKCAEGVLRVVPGWVGDVFFGRVGNGDGDGEEDKEREKERRIKEVEEMLDVFGDAYANKHLMFGIFELIIVRLIGEIAEKGVEELLEERLS